jgi:hypothetical protein
MNIKTIGVNTSLTFQWLIEPQSMKQRESDRLAENFARIVSVHNISSVGGWHL